MNRNIIILSIFLISVVLFSFEKSPKNTVNVYGWYGIMDTEILKDFEKETGIKVVYDVYDNNDTLESKLLATNSGYDVVFPSFIPYAARQCAMGAYAKLDKKLLPNLKNIEGKITEKFEKTGGDIDRMVPIFWGTIGIAYDQDIMKKIFPDIDEVSYNLLFDPDNIEKLSKYGVSFPEEYIDIFPQTATFLKLIDENSIKVPQKIKAYVNHFKFIRKYIKKFSSNTMISDLLSGEVAVAIGASDNAWRARRATKNIGKTIKYVIPKGYGVLWIDCVGIPAKAPHKENAYKFLNYLLRPDVAAKITNHSGILVNISEARKFFKDEIKDDEQICPSNDDILENLMIGSPSKTSEEAKNDKMATRAWLQIRMNEFNYTGDLK